MFLTSPDHFLASHRVSGTWVDGTVWHATGNEGRLTTLTTKKVVVSLVVSP